ncbi:hypothetical protein [Ulvibacterium sp.]|uniref:hypothetical protein n=1 Tax=Ulvibacterium sp. TaxID=2665914 RepID=UPI002609A65C|nr:hypothetical protein [Ulvibacterium sp.]
MRKISLVFVAAMLLSAGSVFANGPKENDPTQSIKTQVRKLLRGYSMPTSEKDLTATILFTVNKQNEFVVLSVETEDEVLEYFVKSRLNYHKVNSKAISEGRRYTMPIKIVS